MKKRKTILASSKTSSGQVALVILTVMAIALTWALSMGKRSAIDLETSRQSQESTQAFSAAEAGIEEALRVIREGEDVSTINTSSMAGDLGVDQIAVSSATVGGGSQFQYPQYFKPGETVIVWLRDHFPDGSIDENNGYDGTRINICWQTGSALEVIYFHGSLGNYGIRRYAFDDDVDRRNSTGGANDGNHFSSNVGSGCTGLGLSTEIDLTSGTPLFLVLRPFYQQTKIGVVGTTDLPVQGYEIISSGEIDQGEEQKISRKVRVFHNWKSPLSVVFNSIFSGAGVSGN